MKFADPENNVKQFGLKEGQVVADLGAGPGAYAIACARVVGGSGRVYAVEVQKDLVNKVEKEAREQGFSNIEVRWGDIEEVGGTKIRDDSVDAVILSNILFQVEDWEGLAKEIKRISKPSARILIIDWSDSFGGLGPAPESIVKDTDARSFFEQKGYVFEGFIKAGAHHFGFSMEKI